MSLSRLVLVINESYEPINICSARRAMTLVLKGAAVVQEVSAYVVRTSKIALPIPSVVRLQKYRRGPRLKRGFFFATVICAITRMATLPASSANRQPPLEPVSPRDPVYLHYVMWGVG